MDEIDDNTLRYELESRGQSIGPIVDSTRNLYRKLLQRLIDEEMESLEDNDLLSEDAISSDTTSAQSSAKSSIDGKLMEAPQRPKSQLFLFLLSLLLCIIFAYFVKNA